MKTSRGNFARGLALPLMGAVAALAFVPKDLLAADNWMSCTGTLTTVPTDKNAKPVPSETTARTLVFNDELRLLYQYSKERQALDLMPVASYTPQQIKWGSDIYQNGGMKWEGTLNRADSSVSLKRVDPDTVMTWTEKCSPTAAMPVK